MVSLATSGGQSRTTQELAADAHVPLDYLSKILNSLAKAGLITGQRGRGGGFHPTARASGLTVLEVVSAVDPLKRIKTCPLGLAAHGTNLCPLHRKIDDAMQTVEVAFAGTTIESLVGKSFCETEECHAV
ncbi:MAG: transcriptional regulator, BadM/Rrf2 family [Bryobacterales bacterium]|nr:transcriptional regulator, BadM/Rrf2 family [Bryobacterales bacterium]